MFLKNSIGQRLGVIVAAAAIAMAAACSGGGNPTPPFPSGSKGAGTGTYTVSAVNGVNSTVLITGTGSLSVSASASAPTVGAIPQVKKRAATSGGNTSLIYYSVAASTAATLSAVTVEVGFAAAPTTNVYLAYWNGTEWVAGSTPGTFEKGVVSISIPKTAFPITLAAGQSLYLAVYEGVQIGTPPPPSPIASPNPISMDLLASTTVTVVTQAGLTITATSSMPNIATVTASATANPSGVATFTVTSSNPGTTTLTFEDPIGQKTTDVVTVNNTLPSPQASPAGVTVGVGAADEAIVDVNTASGLKITATNTNASIAQTTQASATANSSGVAAFTIEGVGLGATTITFTDPYGDQTTLTVNVSSIANGDFQQGLTGWSACSFTHQPFAAAVNASPAPTPTAWSTQKPTATSPPVTGAALTALAQVTSPPDNDRATYSSPAPPSGVGPTAPPVLGTSVALLGNTGEQGNPAGEFGICQSFTPSSASPYLSFWVWEGGSTYKFSQGDQEADILNQAGTSILTNGTLFAEINCFQDQSVPNLGVPNQFSYDCDPSSAPPNQYYDWINAGYWVERGPYDLSSWVGTPITLYVGQWSYYSNTAGSYDSQYMFLGNVQTTTTDTFPATLTPSMSRRLQLTIPKTRIIRSVR